MLPMEELYTGKTENNEDRKINRYYERLRKMLMHQIVFGLLKKW